MTTQLPMRFCDLPRIASHQFRYDNHCSRVPAMAPCWRDLATGAIGVEPEWDLVGWSDRIDEHLMCNREGQIGLMLFHPDVGEMWQHYPLEKEDMGSAVFIRRKAG